MSKLLKRVPHTVRPRSSGGVPVVLCLLLFGLTATVVYRWGHERWTPVNPHATYTATAYVVPCLRSAALVEAAPLAAGAEARIPMCHTDGDPQRAVAAANASAERYVRDRLAEWKRCTEGPRLIAHEATEKAQREHAQTTARLETFRRQLAEAAQAAARARLTAQPPSPSPPPLVDNPQWLDLDRQLAELQRRYDGLLVDRTPLHPAVRDLASRIAGVKDQLATTPRQVPDTKPRPAVASLPDTKPQPAVAPLTPDALITTADQETLAELTAAVEKSRQACEEAESAENRALQEQKAGPQFTIDRAQAVEHRPPPDYGWRRLMWTTLMTGVLMAFGVGSVSAGANIEPPAASIEEVRIDADVPVVGMIPADDPLPDPVATSRRQSRIRRTLIAIGLLLIAAGPVLAIWGVLGI